MIALTGNATMLYCPKCRRTYEEGSRRFCDNDGGRLLPAPSSQNIEPQGGVFSHLLGKTQNNSEADSKLKSAPRFIPFNKTEETPKNLTSFPSAGRIFQSEQFLKPKKEKAPETDDSLLEIEPIIEKREETSILEFEPVKTDDELSLFGDVDEKTQKPLPRLINPNEIASGTADVGNRQQQPLGRNAFSFENTAVLIGQTVKGRYLINELLEEDDEDSVIYSAEDQIFDHKKVIVRIFLNVNSPADDLEGKILAEERVSLSHLNHPNIAGVFDSGELPEGNEFIVSEFIEGKTLAEMMREAGQFNSLRTARIVRQTSYALSEAHQNGILHRNLKPENIILTVSEAGIEQVKLMNFGVSHGEINSFNLAYKAPEEIEKGVSTYASDIYALAVIGFEMLTGRYPFDFETDSELLKAQKSGAMTLLSEVRSDIQPLTDTILEKALSLNASERYPKARDFGDAFFNALTTVAPWSDENEVLNIPETNREYIVIPAITQKESQIDDTIDISIPDDSETMTEAKTNGELAWEKRSPEPPQTGNSWRGWAAIAGVVALLLVFWGASRLYFNNANRTETSNQSSSNEPVNLPVENVLPPVDGDMPPSPRVQITPEGLVRFQNVRENLKEDLIKNFLGFEIFYSQNWTKTETPNNYFDVSKKADNGLPIEQMIITRYESRGTMTLDRPNFPKLVEKSNQDLKKPNNLGDSYKVISEGETSIQNGRWKAYEVKFQGFWEINKGEKITVWGRRLWIPVQRAGVQNGFVMTMLATSLSDEVKNADEVGTNGDLAKALETFEPEQVDNR